MAAVVLDDPVHHRQPEAGPLSLRLGGEEGLEDPVEDLRLHPHPGVLHHHLDVVTGLQAGTGAHEPRVQVRQAGLEGDAAALRKGIARVDRHAQENLAHLAGVGVHVGKLRVGLHVEGDARIDALGQERHGLLEQQVHVERLEALRAAAREVQELPGQDRGPLGLLLDGRRLAEDRVVLAHQASDVGGIAEDGADDVVEVVRDAGGEGADRLHLLRLHQLGRNVRGSLRQGGHGLRGRLGREAIPAGQVLRLPLDPLLQLHAVAHDVQEQPPRLDRQADLVADGARQVDLGLGVAAVLGRQQLEDADRARPGPQRHADQAFVAGAVQRRAALEGGIGGQVRYCGGQAALPDAARQALTAPGGVLRRLLRVGRLADAAREAQHRVAATLLLHQVDGARRVARHLDRLAQQHLDLALEVARRPDGRGDGVQPGQLLLALPQGAGGGLELPLQAAAGAARLRPPAHPLDVNRQLRREDLGQDDPVPPERPRLVARQDQHAGQPGAQPDAEDQDRPEAARLELRRRLGRRLGIVRPRVGRQDHAGDLPLADPRRVLRHAAGHDLHLVLRHAPALAAAGAHGREAVGRVDRGDAAIGPDDLHRAGGADAQDLLVAVLPGERHLEVLQRQQVGQERIGRLRRARGGAGALGLAAGRRPDGPTPIERGGGVGGIHRIRVSHDGRIRTQSEERWSRDGPGTTSTSSPTPSCPAGDPISRSRAPPSRAGRMPSS